MPHPFIRCQRLALLESGQMHRDGAVENGVSEYRDFVRSWH